MLRICLIAVVLLGGLVPAFTAADEVGVRVANRADYGRIMFLWPSPVTHQLQIENKQLIIRFGRPISASFERVRGALGKYVRSVENLPDGRSVQFELNEAYEAYSYDSGSAVILEIASLPGSKADDVTDRAVRSSTDGIETSDTKSFAQAAQQPAELPDIGVRSGEHADYTRLVFDWPNTVPYTFEQTDGAVVLHFKQAANLGLSRIQQDPPRFVGQIQFLVDADGAHVAIAIPKTASAKHFLSGPKVVVDIGAPTGDAAIADLPQGLLEPKSVPGTGPDAEVVTNDGPPAEPPTPAEAPEVASALPEAKEASAEKPAATGATTTATGDATVPASPGGPTPLVAANRQTSSQVSRSGTAPGAPAAPAAVSGNTGAPGEGTTLKFDWTEPVAAAVFRRVGYLWVVFDKATTVDVAALEQAGAGMVGSVQQLAATSGTVLRMATPREVNPSLSRSGLSWLLNFRNQDFEVRTPISVDAQPNSPAGARIFLPVPEPGTPIGVTDPDVGDNIVIVPTIPLGHGVAQAYTFPEVRVLKSMQGVVVVPITDNLRVRPLRQGVELASSVPLSLSSVSAELAAESKLGALGPVSRILDLEKWKLPDAAAFIKRKQELEAEIATAEGDANKQDIRFELARFYFAHAYAAEAMAVLRLMSEVEPEIEDTAEFRLIRGGSKFLMHRYTEAVDDLGHPSLDDADEGAFWRAAVIAKTGETIAAAHELRRTGNITQPYPKELRIVMTTLATDAIVDIGDIEQAQKYIETLKLLEPTTNQLAEINFVDGKLLEVGGDEEGAIAKWEEVLEVDNRPTRYKATMARQDMLLKLGRMEIPEAIEELEQLRYIWRGDEDEFNLLRRLGGLYLDAGIYRNGLEALRQAATYYRDNENAPAVTQQMSDTFNFLYLENGADSMPPVTAIAIYEEFKELTPAGRQGDEMIRNLADRLVKVDLLDQAAGLLQQQVQFRLQGVEKAEVGMNLALIHALATEQEKVLETLDATEVPDMPDELTASRRHLRAQSMMRLNQREEALMLLKDDKSLDADLIRSQLFWEQNDWKNAALSLLNVVRSSNIRPGDNLTEDQAAKVLNLATAYTLSGNERAIARLRTDYAGAMSRTSLKEAFALVAEPLSLGMIDPGSISDRVKTVTNFRTYLDKYKERLKQERLSNLARDGAIPRDSVPSPGASAADPQAAG